MSTTQKSVNVNTISLSTLGIISAVKCNHDPTVLQALISDPFLGFDCATALELEQVMRLGATPDRIIYAHPVKSESYLRIASKLNVARLSFDNPKELEKVSFWSVEQLRISA